MDEPRKGFERRMVHRLLRHWRDAQVEGGIPSLDAVYKQGLGDIVPQSFVLRVPGGNAEPVFGRIGERFADELGSDIGGKPVSAVPEKTLTAAAVRFHAKVLKRKVPITLGDSFVDNQGRTILYRSIILPTSSDGRTIDYLLCAANSKVAEEGGGNG